MCPNLNLYCILPLFIENNVYIITIDSGNYFYCSAFIWSWHLPRGGMLHHGSHLTHNTNIHQMLRFLSPSFSVSYPTCVGEVHYINMTALTKVFLHSSFWVVDRKHIYIGSATRDWRSLSTVS